MKFKNKNTGAIIETTIKAIENMYRKNNRYEEIKEENFAPTNNSNKEFTVAEIKEKLTELKIEYPQNANKKTLIALLPQKNN